MGTDDRMHHEYGDSVNQAAYETPDCTAPAILMLEAAYEATQREKRAIGPVGAAGDPKQYPGCPASSRGNGASEHDLRAMRTLAQQCRLEQRTPRRNLERNTLTQRGINTVRARTARPRRLRRSEESTQHLARCARLRWAAQTERITLVSVRESTESSAQSTSRGRSVEQRERTTQNRDPWAGFSALA